MDIVSPSSETNRDPFQLERLAEELALRETANQQVPFTSAEEAPTHDLPAYVPLSHENPYLQAATFNVEDFLLSRSYTSLPDLRSDLREYLAALKEELVKLINDDYEAFISLSTDLRDEGERLGRLKAPLSSIKYSILESKKDLEIIQGEIQDKLTKRAKLREEKAILHLLLKISESISRIESLLLISAPADEAAGNGEVLLGKPSDFSEHDEVIADRAQPTQAKHLSRVVAEYTQLLYHASKAREEKCVFVDKMQWRIDRIQSTLSADLDHLFASTLMALIDGKEESGLADIDRAKMMADLTESLRMYDALGLWEDAEEILRTRVVREFVKKTIFPGTLGTPHSPIVPHTPFLPSPTPAFPRTPFTPYTAFKSSGLDSGKLLSSPFSQLLNDKDDPLAKLYNQILRFVERDLSRIMAIAEKVAVKSKTGQNPDTLKDNHSHAMDLAKVQSDNGFEIMANVVWTEFASAIMEELGNVVFASGRPNEFRQHFEISQAFIRSLEFLAPSIRSVEAMRAHPTYTAFQQRWQLPVYFQLRWKDIVTKLEASLSSTSLDPISSAVNEFHTTQAAAVWTAIASCWSTDVYIPELSHRFWKLSLQIISRYKTWLSQIRPAETISLPSNAILAAGTDRHSAGSPAGLSRSSTPGLPTDAQPPESVAADDIILRQNATIISDIRGLKAKILSIWRTEISMMLPQASDASPGMFNAEDALNEMISGLTSLVPPLSNQITRILTRRCCDALLPVRSIPSQFRAMSNKKMPTDASYFVPSILRPIKAFFGIGTSDGYGAFLKDDYLEAYATEIFESVSQRYVYYLTHMRKTEESFRRLKKGKKATFSLFGSANTKDDDGRDEARIRAQMILDVAAYGKEGQSIGIKLERSESFTSLTELVHAPLPDD